ncbi:hypothetical protein EVAR_33711_1 [Eumeta japonica]|uniref:Uncharacterized protein n=1 Tax=Eumeta variegata TaxID=151549 RepID=A0A4C1VT86_EUMVA|nr:hypothetical protein EVAR_33711_1 [Eumeta japonica]
MISFEWRFAAAGGRRGYYASADWCHVIYRFHQRSRFRYMTTVQLFHIFICTILGSLIELDVLIIQRMEYDKYESHVLSRHYWKKKCQSAAAAKKTYEIEGEDSVNERKSQR